MNLTELLDRNELDVLDHLELEAAIPVLDGPQAQGDLIVLPLGVVPTVTVPWTTWLDVPPAAWNWSAARRATTHTRWWPTRTRAAGRGGSTTR